MTTQIPQMLAQIEDLRRTHPEFFAYFEDTELDTASRAELVDLMASAPDDKVRFYIFGKYNARLSLAGATGRAFL